MKPAFALDFRNEAIALLHRTSGGWHQIGRVTFDEPDLPGALSYLRATALGLSPRGLTTKLILPDEQILYTTVDAPGPDDTTRTAQIRAALEGRTPYAVEDLVYDWEIHGEMVRVAVIARETLAEAESFAAEHRFNPVAFGAAPASGFGSDPWFGLTSLAPSLLSGGETVERDQEALVIVDRAPAAEADSAPQDDMAKDAGPADVAPADSGSATAEADAGMPEISQPLIEEPAFNDVAPQGLEPAFPEEAPYTPPDFEYPTSEPVQSDAFEDPANNPQPEFTAPAREFETFAQERSPYRSTAADVRETSIFGLADDEPTPSAAFQSLASQQQDTAAELPADLADVLKEIELDDEAPMAVDVEDDTLDGAKTDQGMPASAGVTDLSIADDVPPTPGFSPAIGFASRRASADDGRSSKVPPPPLRPAVPRPVAAKPLAPVAKAEKPAISRPTAAKPVVAKEAKGLRGFGAFVKAPSLPGSAKKKAQVTLPAEAAVAAASMSGTSTPAATSEPAAAAATKSIGRGLGTPRAPIRGKPRHLGLILTVVLLLTLAVIAAWSTSLAFRSNDAEPTGLAEALPAPDDEMLADGQDPEALAAIDETAVTPLDATEAALAEDTADPVAAEPAPALVADGQDAAPSTSLNPGATSGDEIFLATSDQAPVAPEPLVLPEVAAQGDPLPLAQAPPPPFGTVYQFDANGLIVPTPEGIVTPEGVLLIAGKPPVLPKPRPEGLVVPAPAPATDAAAATDPATNADAVLGTDQAAAAEAPFPSDPALAKFRPKTRPEGLVPPLANPDDASLTPDAEASGFDNRLAGLRPAARPQAVLEAGTAARAASAAASASLAASAEAQAEEEAALAAAAPASKLAVAISRKPAPRPRDLSRAVEAAVAAAIRAPEPTPEPEPEPTTKPKQKSASLQPKPAPEEETKVAASPKPSKDKAHEEADDEPELASAPSGKSQGSVAKQATFKNALNLSKTALIGVYGTPSNRYAMIRTEAGRYKKIKIGDRVDGGKVQAITASEVRYQKGSRLVTLAMPKS